MLQYMINFGVNHSVYVLTYVDNRFVMQLFIEFFFYMAELMT